MTDTLRSAKDYYMKQSLNDCHIAVGEALTELYEACKRWHTAE